MKRSRTNDGPISDADSPTPPFSTRLWCTTVCDDGLTYGASMHGPHCVGPMSCIDRGECFWRTWHQLPSDMMRKKCDEGLDN